MSDNSLFADLETGLKQAIDHAAGKQKGKTIAEFAEQKTVRQENEKK